MGGTISVESKLGAGSDFTVTIPFPICTNTKELTEITGKKGKIQCHQKFNMLLAEDNEDSRFFFERLTNEYYPSATLTIAENGKIAIEKFAEHHFDIIFMDIQMPYLNGVDATEYIRKHFGTKGKAVPIIAITAYSGDEDKKRFFTAGMNDCITKPLDIGMLSQLIGKFVAKQ